MRHARSIGCLAVALLGFLLISPALAGPASSVNSASPCWAPESLLRDARPLPRLAARIGAGKSIRIVAIGSSSTAGAGASSPAKSYPSRLEAGLRERFPTLSVRVLNKGIGGERANQMVARFDRDVVAEHPHLVIWQVGTNSLINDEPFDGNLETISRGLARLKRLGFDVIVMNPQFAPRVTARPSHLTAVAGIAKAARQEGVWVFPRFEIMRHWVESGHHTLDTLLVPDQLHLSDLTYQCIATLLAGAIEAAVKHPGDPVTESNDSRSAPPKL